MKILQIYEMFWFSLLVWVRLIFLYMCVCRCELLFVICQITIIIFTINIDVVVTTNVIAVSVSQNCMGQYQCIALKMWNRKIFFKNEYCSLIDTIYEEKIYNNFCEVIKNIKSSIKIFLIFFPAKIIDFIPSRTTFTAWKQPCTTVIVILPLICSACGNTTQWRPNHLLYISIEIER